MKLGGREARLKRGALGSMLAGEKGMKPQDIADGEAIRKDGHSTETWARRRRAQKRTE